VYKHELEALTLLLCDNLIVKKTRSYLPTTQHALNVLGSQIAIARRELGWTAAELAERLGVNAQLVARIEKGAPGTAIGTVFEAAVLTGVPLYGVDPADLEDLADRQRARLALLPARTRARHAEVSDDF
jgi:transcriptional regulator with XRE-family HTH domain